MSLAAASSALVPALGALAPGMLHMVSMLQRAPYVTQAERQRRGVGSASSTLAGTPHISDLKSHAATLHDRLCDLHERFSQTAKAKEVPADWHQTWQAQVRQVSATQKLLKSRGVPRGAAAALAEVAAATDCLETSLTSV